MLQRQLAAALEIGTPMHSKIERSERRAKRKQALQRPNIIAGDGLDENRTRKKFLQAQTGDVINCMI